MKKTILVILTLIALSACAHKDLKAPCANVAALTSGTVPCDQPEPINSRPIPRHFAAL